ncbi:MAG: hypothetical protein DWC02_00925 [Candidatus Poseidoniales archaeon]|nr:MAG: hypothetical protein DWC02_00925 [Candidatus Poseidoniales archaeon]
MEKGDSKKTSPKNNPKDMDVSVPIFSLSIPLGVRKYLTLFLYAVVIISLLAIAELNPWGNDLNNPSGLDEENDYSSFIDVPWAELKPIHHGTIDIEKGLITSELDDRNRYCSRESPSNVWIKANTSGGKEIDIFVPKNSGPRISLDSPDCGEEVTQAEVYVEKNDNGSFELLSWAIYDTKPEDKTNFEHIRWAVIGTISAFLLLKLQPTELQNRIEKIRRKNSLYSKTTVDEWVIYDSWDLVKNRDQEGELISEHPTKLPKTESGVITPWIFLVGTIFLLLHILFREIFIFGGSVLLVFLNHDLDYGIIAFIVGAFVITVGPYVLIGKLFNLRSNIANSFGIIFKKRRFVKMIDDVPTSTIRGMSIGRVEVAGVALKMRFDDYSNGEVIDLTPNQNIIKRVDERVVGIQNPDNWPIFRKLSGVKKKDLDPNHQISFIVHDGTGSVVVKMPRKNFVLGALRAKNSTKFSSKSYWTIDEGDPVLVIGEAIIGDDGQIYIGSDGSSNLPSAVFKGTEWTVQGGFRSTLEYVLADILFAIVFIIFMLQFWGVL